MNINVIGQCFSRNGGGIFTVIKELYNTESFKESGYSKMNFWGYHDQYSIIDHKLLPGIKYLYHLKYPKLNKFYFSKELEYDLKNTILPEDIVHLHSLWLYPSLLISKLQRKKGFIKIISTHGMLDKWALKNRKYKKIIAMKLFENSNITSANCIHALCEQEYLDIRKIAIKVPIAIIPNGINLPKTTYVKKNKKQERILLFISRIHQKKGLENLICAWEKANTKNWTLVIAGPDENNHTFKLIQLIKEFNLEKSIKLIGPKFGIEKTKLLSNSDAFILPSYSEGLPMSILEAWSYKLPVLMTPQCNLPCGFETNSAILIEPEIKSIVSGLNTLFSMNSNDLNIMGNNGYNLVREKYNWETIAKQMIELYDWALGKIEKPSFVHLD